MKIFDEGGNFLGDFVEASSDTIKYAKDTVCDLADVSIVLGIIGLILAPGLTLAIIGILFIFHLFLSILKVIFKSIWWVIKLPFTLLFLHKLPEF